ncbi:MAG: hypothetical protein BWX92_03842 [Deltaproteobacteria bacterium ADurb.Bin135]|nr:MAG: hypothetical protein BWX92_03842 [Deltaproteobacteria bacterium ADurb.Bin135]
MKDLSTERGKTIDWYVNTCHSIATDHGWWDTSREIPELLCLVHSEVSEALEAYRTFSDENFVEELADVLIRIFDMSGHLGIDLEGALLAKIEVNSHRPYRHGNKRV